MAVKTRGFAQYSKSLCWIVSFISLLLAGLDFISAGESSMINGFLWLAVAFAFAISAIFLNNKLAADESPEHASD